jgi:CelD/BcsL family acetyltransferase involved in cellulose biosynthesis
MLTIEEVRGTAAFATLCAEWQTLYRASDAAPFLTWEWLSAWHEQLGAEREPLLLCARAAGQLVGLLPLSIEQRQVARWCGQLRRVAFLGEAFGGADYLDALVLPARRTEVCQALFTHLLQHVEFDWLELEGLAADSPNLPLLERLLAQQRQANLRRTPHYTCPQVELKAGWPELLAHSRRRDNFNKKLRRMQQRHAFEYRVVTQAAEIEAAFERYYALHERRWLEHGGSDATGHARLREFQRAAVQRLAVAGLARFEEIWLDGVCVASNYALDDGRNYYFYSTGYDQAYHHLSPGGVLIGLTIESACARGLQRFDFLRGDEGYKAVWANGARETVTLTLARRSVVATLHLARQQVWEQLRNVVKTALPAPVVTTLRNWLRLARRQQSFAPDNV